MSSVATAQRSPGLVDRWRLDAGSTWSASSVHEWHHFIVFAGRRTLLVNFSRTVDLEGRVIGRVLVLVHHDGWVDHLTIDPAPWFSRDGRMTEIGPHRLGIDDDGWSVRVARGTELDLDLRCRPRSAPLVANNSDLSGSARFHWVMFPEITVGGRLRVGDEEIELRAAPGYHDHNWGPFAWGDDFGWEWAVVGAAGPARTTVVATALTNRAHTVRRVEQMFLWCSGAHVWTARGADVTASASGAWPTRRCRRVPAALALVTPPPIDGAVRHRWIGDDGRRRVELDLELADRCQVLVPDERDPCGVIVLTEAAGTATVRLSTGGVVEHELRSPCVHETLRGGARAG